MGIEIIGKLTQKNNGDFKLVDLANVDYDGTGKSAKQELEKKIEEAKNSSTPYDDSAIKADINTIKTNLGTETLNTTAKDVKGAVNEVAAQYKDITQQMPLSKSDIDDFFKTNTAINIDYIKTKQIENTRKFERLKNLKESFTICCKGDSLTYGHDTVSSDKRPALEGHSTTRASVTYPEALKTCLDTVYKTKQVTIINQGYSGDTVETCYNRWQTYSNSDVVILCLGTNDFRSYNDISRFIKGLELLVIREILWGASVVLLTPPKMKYEDNVLNTYSKVIELVGLKYGITVVNSEEMLSNYSYDIYSDDTHLNGKGYKIWGTRLAGLFVGNGYHDIKKINSSDMLLSRLNADSVTYISNCGKSNNKVCYTPTEKEDGKGICSEFSTNGEMIYSFYTEQDNMVCFLNGYIETNGEIDLTLDFDNTTQFLNSGWNVNNKGKISNLSTVTIKQVDLSGKFANKTNQIKNGTLLHIAKKGLHTIKIKLRNSPYVFVEGLEFLTWNEYYLLNKLSYGSYYYGVTKLFDGEEEVTTTEINVSELNNILNRDQTFIDEVSKRDLPLKITLYNSGESVLQYVFSIGKLTDGYGFAFKSEPTRINITETPTSERTITNIKVADSKLVITWGGVLNRVNSFTITPF